MSETTPDAASGSQKDPNHTFATLPTIPKRVEDPTVVAGRLVVSLVIAVVVTVGAFAAAVGQFFAGSQKTVDPTHVQVGPLDPLVSNDLPPGQLVVVALLTLVGVAAAAVTFETISALMSVSPRREILESLRSPLPRVGPPEQIKITVLVPAHNEEVSLPITLAALGEQTRPPDKVVVVADNCTDRTVAIAHELGYEVFESVNNVYKKAGALNQALATLLPSATKNDVVMIMDADTALAENFLKTAAEKMSADPELAAVGGVFFGEGGHGLIGQFQRNEYARYSLQIRSRHGRVFVLTGTASLFRAEVLLDVAASRGVYIPGATGNVYDTDALTEDNELTLALKSLGATMTSPAPCRVTTELMPTWKNLWVQRKRWQRGALENLSAYGITRATIRYWGQQVGIGYGTVALNLALLLMLITILAVDEWIWFPFWVVVGFIFILERVITAWSGGWRARLLAAALLPELFYDVFLQIVFVKCLLDIALAKRTTWGHVEHVAGGQ